VLRRVLIGAVSASLAAVFAAPAFAYSEVLMPGVSYSRQVQFTAHGPVVIHVLTAPRPGGNYALKPILSNGSIVGRERVTSMQKDISDSATLAGVNGDLFNFKDGHPTGIVMQGGVLQSQPYRNRSSVGVSSSGALNVAKVAFYGYWQGLGHRWALTGLNQPPRGDGAWLFTPAWGPATPRMAGAVEAVLAPFPSAVPGQDLGGTVAAMAFGGGTPIPRNGAVLMGHGPSATRVASEAPPATRVAAHLILAPDWPAAGITDAIGGGPMIVRNGRAVWNAGEGFLPTQLGPRNPRTAVGQRRDGKILLVAVDGRRRGYSVGLTNFELAQAMVRLGAVTASALDSGGSTTMAFDGKLLNRPSDPGGERAVADSLSIFYTGVYAPPAAQQVISPNGDGIAERQALSYKVVRPSDVDATLVGPGGATGYIETGERNPGVYKVTWPASAKSAAAQPLGRWRWVVTATDAAGNKSSVERAFWLNDTLGFLRVVRTRGGRAAVARFRLAHEARVTPSISTRAGVLVRRLPSVRMAAGTGSLAWNGRYGNGRRVYGGAYVFTISARNAFGPTDLSTRFVVRGR
jgi:Phosphodiester glycosidase/FlgD Ig-like domain